MALYLKALGRDTAGNLVSCHGGEQVWPDVGGTVCIPKGMRSSIPCHKGMLHALRLRDLPFWLGTHYIVVDMPNATAQDTKVYGYEAMVVRALSPEEFNGLDYCVAFAEWCAEQGTNYNDKAAADFLAGMFPSWFLEGVER